MKFRKTATIDAEQYLPELGQVPEGVCEDRDKGHPTRPHVHTMHDNQTVVLESGDWIVPEPTGINWYPIKASVMSENYEPVEDRAMERPA